MELVPNPRASTLAGLTRSRAPRVDSIQREPETSPEGVRVREGAAKEIGIEISRPRLDQRKRSPLFVIEGLELDDDLPLRALEPHPLDPGESHPLQIGHRPLDRVNLEAGRHPLPFRRRRRPLASRNLLRVAARPPGRPTPIRPECLRPRP